MYLTLQLSKHCLAWNKSFTKSYLLLLPVISSDVFLLFSSHFSLPYSPLLFQLPKIKTKRILGCSSPNWFLYALIVLSNCWKNCQIVYSFPYTCASGRIHRTPRSNCGEREVTQSTHDVSLTYVIFSAMDMWHKHNKLPWIFVVW